LVIKGVNDGEGRFEQTFNVGVYNALNANPVLAAARLVGTIATHKG
jgi:hypothetical protein